MLVCWCTLDRAMMFDRYERALSVERGAGAILIDPRAACYGQFVPLHRIFNSFRRVAMYISECGE